ASRGLCSRRAAERLIERGLVLVDGIVMREQGCKARPYADIRIAADAEEELAAQITIVLHKPVGIVSTQPEPGQTPAWKLVTAANAHGGIDASRREQIAAESKTLAVAGRL